MLPSKMIQLSVEDRLNRIISEHNKCYEGLSGVGGNFRKNNVGKFL